MVKLTSDDLDGNIESPQPSYQQNQEPTQTAQGSGAGGAQGSLQKYNGILSEVNQLLQQLDNLGIMQTPGGQQQQAPGQPGPQQTQQQQPQASEPQGQQQEQQGQDIDALVNQSYSQLMQFVNLMQTELGEDGTLEETEKYMVENEQGMKGLIRQQIEERTQ